MPVSRQEIIDAYGHFFVVCDAHESGYISRIFSEVEKYNWILENGHRPFRVPKKLVIKEFFGRPKYRESYGDGVLGFPTSDRDKSVFLSLESARARANEVIDQVNAMFVKIREIEKTHKLDFSSVTPKIPVELDSPPETLEFPDPKKYSPGAEIFCIAHNLEHRELVIHEAKIDAAKLYPIQASSEPFVHKYDLDISFLLPDDDGTAWTDIDATLTCDPQGMTFWKYQRPTTDFGGTSVSIFKTREAAEEGAQEFARKALKNIGRFAPPVPAVAG